MEVAPPIGLAEVLARPQAVVDELVQSGAIYGLTAAEVRFESRNAVCIWLTLEPWLATAADGYPVEEVAVTMCAGGTIISVPRRASHRTWLHRFPAIDPWWLGRGWWRWFESAPRRLQEAAVAHAWAASDPSRFGQLCLWFPDDPPALKWDWSDGLVAYITIVHRHLQAEEFWRRTGSWPAEDAPHGEGVHPIRSPEMQTAAGLNAA
jgi:hypothetical protein